MPKSRLTFPVTTPRQVKEAFFLAERMKNGPYEMPALELAIARVKAEIAALSDSELDSQIKDPKRLQQINEAKWYFGKVQIARCRVWPGMGKRPWATGDVPGVGVRCVKHSDPSDRLWKMAERAKTLKQLPLIVHSRIEPRQYRIDDGCHRAVALFLAGIKEAEAYIGDVPVARQHTW